MEEKRITNLAINNVGTVGSIVSNYIESYITEDDMKKINFSSILSAQHTPRLVGAGRHIFRHLSEPF